MNESLSSRSRISVVNESRRSLSQRSTTVHSTAGAATSPATHGESDNTNTVCTGSVLDEVAASGSAIYESNKTWGSVSISEHEQRKSSLLHSSAFSNLRRSVASGNNPSAQHVTSGEHTLPVTNSHRVVQFDNNSDNGTRAKSPKRTSSGPPLASTNSSVGENRPYGGYMKLKRILRLLLRTGPIPQINLPNLRGHHTVPETSKKDSGEDPYFGHLNAVITSADTCRVYVKKRRKALGMMNRTDRAWREAKVLSGLLDSRCPYILRIHGVVLDFESTDVYSILELTSGTLETLLEHCPHLNDGEMLSLTYQMTKGLEFMHAHHLVHRRVNPCSWLVKVYHRASATAPCGIVIVLGPLGASPGGVHLRNIHVYVFP